MAVHAVVKAVFRVFRIGVRKATMAFHTVSITVLIASIAVDTTSLIFSHAAVITPPKFSQIKRHGIVRILKAAVRSSLINRIATCTTLLIVSHTVVTTPEMAFQMVDMVVWIAVIAPVTTDLIPSQMPTKKFLMPVRTPVMKVVMRRSP